MDLEGWHDFFLATTGASAALAGLIIVAMSVNIKTIIDIPSMTSRAASTIASLVLILIVGSLYLIPGQAVTVLAVEVLIAGIIATALAAHAARRIWQHRQPFMTVGAALFRGVLGLLGPLVVAWGGIWLVAGAAGGTELVAAGILIIFITTVSNTWVLLVEILR
jgi:modulator of FtsH protease